MMPYCPKCGKEVKDDAVFCPYCGESLKQQDKVVYRQARDEKGEKNEKDEKDQRGEKAEKNEKSEKNEGAGGMWSAVMGGLIVLWLGITFLLRQYNYVANNQWWNWFMIGLGGIIIIRGLILYNQINNWRAASGLLIGGAIVALIGASSYLGVNDWWAFIIILIGVWIVANAFMSRSKNPRP
jgi:cation transport ATPase